MNAAKLRVAKSIGRLAVACTAAGVCASVSAYTMPGGTITFHGALYSPLFMIGARSAAQSDGFVSLSETAVDATGAHVASVSFDALPNSAPSAEVSIRAADGRAKAGAIETRFIDGHGRRIASKAGAFHVGAAGGVLSMRGKDSGPMTLVTTYN
ncbi:hypothetical protein BVER_02308c [Candidatus Burkholderia verschuerenii]|uniref:Uncharacterized protein n=1 Tax=Candidatus Burkholderia verschuerenii TaxID=242163 RepID=A0A0L0M4Q5_9BURK|nr:hypothetical protein [Candidatus Burkholderia verschuerenii]KND57607.1 hypothetical protein BVER_02308c [Candidatus Burkholderia verschuerenii]